MPSGLDPWNQLLGKMPGHYGRHTYKPQAHQAIPPPEIHWQDQAPLFLDGPYEARLNHWLTLVQQGEVIEAYRIFLGLLEEPEQRPQLLAQLVFAGLIDVQDRMLHNRSYTTGHKAYRARATVELGEAIGWDQAHDIVYAGVLDIAVGPRWHAAYEMACQVSWTQLAQEQDKPTSSLAFSPTVPSEQRLHKNREPLTKSESTQLIRAVTQAHEPTYIDAITSLLLAGKAPRQIIDVLQVAAAQVLLETGQSPELCDVTARLRIHQLVGLVLRYLRPSTSTQIAVCGRIFYQSVRRLGPEHVWQWCGRHPSPSRSTLAVTRRDPDTPGRRSHYAQAGRERGLDARLSGKRL